MLEAKATQALVDTINAFPSINQAQKTAAMIGAYDPVTGKIAVGSSNGKITAESLHPDTVAYVESQLDTKIGDFTTLCSNKAGACAEVSAADQLIRQGANPADIQFTDALVPRIFLKDGEITPATIKPTCNNCGVTWPKGTK